MPLRKLRSCYHKLPPALTCVNPRRNIRPLSTASNDETRPITIFSGIQPTGIPHLGNYLGALQSWARLARSARPEDTVIFSVVGYHAITLPQDRRHLEEERLNMTASLYASGIDPDKAIVFHQDQVPEHTELAWILNCITPVGKLQRMTTWKSRLAVSRMRDESEIDEAQLNLGLLAYPVLQAADVLLYKATHVPVGEDQTQHLELVQDLARTFNNQFHCNIFHSPRQLMTPTKRVLSLRDPTQKMSKSAPSEQSRILINDDPATIAAKIRASVTDSEPEIAYDPVRRPGVSNLLSILAACSSDEGEDVLAVACRYEGKRHSDLKRDVTDAVVAKLEPVRKEFERLKADEGFLRRKAREGDGRARQVARRTIAEVKEVVGLSSL